MLIGVCDDQKEMRELIVDNIKNSYRTEDIRTYCSGQEVLDASPLPDILFLDIQMPGMDGLETAGKLRKLSRQMIIIFVTVAEDYVFQSFDVGAFHYLVKPFDNKKFAEVLQNAVRQFQERELESINAKKGMPRLMVNIKGEHITVPLDPFRAVEIIPLWN